VPLDIQKALESAGPEESRELNLRLDRINTSLQRIQREAGNSFVSRTRLRLAPQDPDNVVVLRSVIMNPMTTPKILDEILDEQEALLAGLAKA
jgi:hypothetical protein